MPGIDVRELLQPSVYPHTVERIQLRETHVSWVILTGSFAYKVKKPVKLDFVDMTQPSRRRFLCHEELRLNRRLAPDLYLDVVSITRDEHGVHVGGTGSAVDYAVRMKQFDASQELPALLERRDVSCAEMAALAARLADFHTLASRSDAARDFDYRDGLSHSVLGNLATLIAHRQGSTGNAELGHLLDWTHDTLHELLPAVAEREASGFVRECHGDLHAHNIVRWDGRLTPFDCLEFDARLRFIDVMSDIAFLVMDLVSYRREDLAYQFLSSYLEVAGDYGGIRWLPFYAVYRALVRAMVDALGAEQRPADSESLKGRMLARMRTAVEFTRAPKPTLYIMHGPSGSGKSWLSERLVPMLGAIRIRSDIERKRLLKGSDGGEGQAAEASRYTPEKRERIYRHLMDCAKASLAAGVSVIIDATFLRLADRQAFRALAARLAARFVILACTAEKTEIVRRIESRSRQDPSDADVAIFEKQWAHLEALSPAEECEVVRVDTASADWESQVRALERNGS
jgi:aminoglycoside phosphotransferase family enzyme/predicted kinase